MSPQQAQGLVPQCRGLQAAGLVPVSHSLSRGHAWGCLGWVFPWGQKLQLAAFLGRGCLGTRLCSSMALCPPPPPGRHGGLALALGSRWDGVSEPGEAEPLPLALSLWVGATVPGLSAC